MSAKPNPNQTGITAFGRGLLKQGGNLDRQAWWNWFLLVLVCVVTTVGLGVNILILLQTRGPSPWPWSKSEIVLVGTLVTVSLLFLAYISYQQHRLGLLRRERFLERLTANLDVTRSLSETDPQAVFDQIAETCRRIYECDQVSLMLLDEEEGILEVCAAKGHPNAAKLIGARQKVGHGIAGWVAEREQPVILGPDLDRGFFREAHPRVHSTTAAMVVPILLDDELLGVLNVSNREGRTRFDEEDLRSLMLLATNAGICCRQVQERTLLRGIIQDHEVIGGSQKTFPLLGRPRKERPAA
jgi:putative methionine-R-sulfoxide reductase with GAF domain